jgi:hypothetical protein
MVLIPYAVKLARYHAGKAAALKKHRTVLRLRRKQKAKAHLKEVLKMAREALGWKPGGPKGGKLSAEHKAALHAGRDRYHQAKKKKKKNTGSKQNG